MTDARVPGPASGAPRHPARVALVLQGFDVGGGIPATARWLRDGLHDKGDYRVDIHDLASSRSDPNSRRLLRPLSWPRRSLRRRGSNGVTYWGANGVELEPMRYRPRVELTRVLNEYDIVQIVAGAPALAGVARHVEAPVVLLTATLVEWERESQLSAMKGLIRLWRTFMTRLNVSTERRALRQVEHIFVINNHTREHLSEGGLDNVTFAPPGIDTERFTPHPEGWQSTGPLLSICRLADSRKRLDRTVRAYELLVSSVPGVPDLILAGKGKLSREVVDLIEILGLGGRIRVMSDVAVEELPGLMREASVFLQTSQEEGLGLSVVEAMASGLPVVATSTAGSRETVEDGVTGWLVPQTTEDEIAERTAGHVRILLSGTGAEMGRRGRARSVERFSQRVAIARVTDVYDRLGADD